MSEWEHSPERERYQPPEHPLRPLTDGRAVDTGTGEIVILEPAEIEAEPHDDTSERMAPLRATLAAITNPALQENHETSDQ